MQRVLFVGTGNAARSQMAEAMLRAWAGDRYEVASAGTEITDVRPEAVAVMAEMGIDISSQHSKPVGEFLGQPWQWVITVCETARHTCPVFPGAVQTDHWTLDDPSKARGHRCPEARRLPSGCQGDRRPRSRVRARGRSPVHPGDPRGDRATDAVADPWNRPGPASRPRQAIVTAWLRRPRGSQPRCSQRVPRLRRRRCSASRMSSRIVHRLRSRGVRHLCVATPTPGGPNGEASPSFH